MPTVAIKWGKQAIESNMDPSAGLAAWKQSLSDQTGVPTDRVKLLAKGLWKGILNDSVDLSTIDFKGKKVTLMGSATQAPKAPTKPVVFVEDLPEDQVAALVEPAGLVNLGNTCYLNSVVQCLRVIPDLRPQLADTPLAQSLQSTLTQLDRQTEALTPAGFVQAVRINFPQFNRRIQNVPQQQDAEEFLNTLLTGVVDTGNAQKMDDLFGITIEESFTCTEVEDLVTTSKDNSRKLVCNIQGDVSHLTAGLTLNMGGTMEKHVEVLDRNAVWNRQAKISKLPPILTLQFGRFYWKQVDEKGVKCKIMKPVAFDDTLDIYEFCGKELQDILKISRDAARKQEEDAIQAKLDGQGDSKPAAKEDEKMDEAKDEDKMDESMDDPDLQAALAMSMQPEAPKLDRLPENFQGIYELFAVVTHKGRDADGGHYMAWVKADRQGHAQPIADTKMMNEDWYVFDDDEVSPCKTEDVLKLKGGGDWHMSYLNFYRPKK